MTSPTTREGAAGKTVKAWMVLWEPDVFEMYGISPRRKGDEIVGGQLENFTVNGIGVKKLEPTDYADYALFSSKKKAEAYRTKNAEWRVVECTITYEGAPITNPSQE